MATHSSVLAWRIPGMAEPGGLPSMGSHRIGHDWSDLAAAELDKSKLCAFVQVKYQACCMLFSCLSFFFLQKYIWRHDSVKHEDRVMLSGWELVCLSKSSQPCVFYLFFFFFLKSVRDLDSQFIRHSSVYHCRCIFQASCPSIGSESLERFYFTTLSKNYH